MALSYSLRLVCLVAAGIGLLQTIFEVLLWICAPGILRVLGNSPLRQQERVLFTVQVLPFLLAALVTGFCWVPQYVANETNFAPEEVGRICLVLAAIIALRWSASTFSGIGMVIRTTQFTRGLLRGNVSIHHAAGQIPVVSVSGTAPRVALVGLLRPFILISRSMTESGGLDPLALDLILEHERSHAAHLDNWKLLSLQCLPRLSFPVSEGKTWMQFWRSATERAADEDAVQGSTPRALRLAETLVALARARSTFNTQLVCTHLICTGTELASRVDRLTQLARSRQDPPSRSIPAVAVAGGLAVFIAAGVLLSLGPLWAGLTESLLHLG